MQFRVFAWVAACCGILVLAACGSPEPTAAGAPEPPGARTGEAAIAALAPPADEPVATAAEADAGSPDAVPAEAPVQLAAATERGTPRIVVEEPIFDFGSMEVGTKREHSWVIRNEGDADLHITSVRPSCGCTNTQMADDIIPPGGYSTLSSVLDLPRQVGPVRKNIAIYSNDPQQGTVVVAFTGTATQAIIMDPQVLAFQGLERDAAVTQTVDIYAYEDDLQFTLPQIRAESGEFFDASIETVEEGRRYRVHVTTKPPYSADYLRDRIYIWTDHEELQLLQLTVVGNVLNDIISMPDIIRLSADHEEPLKRMILLRAGRISNFKVTGVDLPNPGMSYEVTERQAGMVYVEVSNIVANPELSGTEIVIHTDAPSVPEIRVPITVVGSGDRTFPTLVTGSGEAPASE
jgi:hypothetical protein